MRKIEMIKQAIKENGIIRPCSYKRSFVECFTEENGKMILWFNTPLNNSWTTKVIIEQ